MCIRDRLYTLLTTLEIIRKRYFRGVARKSSANREYNEKIIIKLIRSRKLTGTQIEKYEDMLITTLLKEKGEADFPLIINLDPQGLLLEHDVMQELLNILKEKAGQKVEAYIQIRVIENPKQELDLHSRPELSPLPEIKEWSQEKPFSKNEQNVATMVVPQNRILTLPLPISYPSSQSQPSPALTFSQFSPFYHKQYPHSNSNKRYFSNIQRIPSIIGSPMDVQNGMSSLESLYLQMGLTFLPSEYFNHKLQEPVSYTHLRAHETSLHLVCRLLLEKKKKKKSNKKKRKDREKR
eukprot:TRINITY_DN5253_c0_g1_i1.p1 TRINITY_DN5253_c0_g1~~TRINITY_DN5253_c0_g1_i1.p1  ORF type:complete len:294 (-),score=51.25 TRINITY_DN5253_c0_g1_i1:61-942(-)